MTEKFGLTPEEAIEQARAQIEIHEGEERQQLMGIDSDTAWELGYRSALYDIDRYRQPDPFEVEVVTYEVPDLEENRG